MEQHYKFSNRDFDDNGTNTKDSAFFLDLVGGWEKDFHERFSPFFSNCLFGNASAMILVKKCFVAEPDEDYGMELINGEIDLEKNLTLENYSKRQTVYAIGSRFDLDEPMFLVRDDDMVDGLAILKYVPDTNDENETTPVMPIGIEKITIR
jgi:hypothetical protein